MKFRRRVNRLVFPGPVRSGYGCLAHPNRDCDRLHLFSNTKKTRLNHQQLVMLGYWQRLSVMKLVMTGHSHNPVPTSPNQS
jgi:hypothetical protein